MVSSPVWSVGRRALWLAVSTLALGGCEDRSTPGGGAGGSEPAPLTITEGCNPLYAEGDCLLPFPSDLFRGAEGLAYPAATWIPFDEQPVDVGTFHAQDGFSVGSPILAVLPGGVDPAGLPFFTGDIADSTSAASPTWIVDAETGARVPHFAEVDPNEEDPAKRTLILRPLDRLEGGRRYVVGLRGLTSPGGEPVVAPPGFANLRDDAGQGHPALAALSPRYEAEVFGVLEGAGLPRGELLLAWDFTTRTDASAMGDMLRVRELVMERFEEAPPEATLGEIDEDPNPSTARRLHGTMRVPLYVEDAQPGALLHREGGEVTANGEVDVPFTVWIPKSVAARTASDPPARLMQFGHGFFGTRDEVNGFAAPFAEEHGFVVVAVDWWGMSTPDRNVLIEKLTGDPGNLMVFTDRVHQGMANQIALAEVAARVLPTWPELQREGQPIFDPEHVYFYGISMGHILGGTYTALAPRVDRAVLDVGGANFSLMMFRARPFSAFLALLLFSVPEAVDRQKFAALVQGSFDRIDPMSYAPHVIQDPLPGSPSERHVLIRAGVGDTEVPNLATFLHARMVGVPVLGEAAPFVPLGMNVTPPPAADALSIFDLGYEASTAATPPIEGNEVHEATRALPAAKAQVNAFFRPDGTIINACSGVCDPE